MSEMVLTGNETFLSDSKVKVNKRKVISTLNQKLEKEKCVLLKETLKSMNISYDDSITDVNVLLKNLKESLTESEYSTVLTEYEKIVKELDRVCESLKAGSTTAFTNFVNKYIKGIGASVVDSGAVSMAFRTAILAAPTVELKIAAGAASLLYSGYKLIKNDKSQKLVDKEFEIDRILTELETTKNAEGVITDTRFSERNQQLIREFLKDRKVEFYDTGYLSLRQAINSLSVPEKEQLAIMLVSYNGLDIPVQERLQKYDASFLADLKSHVIKPVGAAAAAGVGIATTVNTIDNTLISGPVNGTIVGTWLLNKLSTGKTGSWLAKTFGMALGPVSGIAGEKVIEAIPIAGEQASKLFSLENLAICSTVGAGIGIVGAAASGIVNAVKKVKKRFDYRKERKKLEQVDNELYGKQDIEEITKMREYLSNNPTPEETSIIGIVKEYMDELGIEYRKNPTSILALKQDLQELNNSDKNKVYQLLEALEETNHKEPNKFKAFLKKAGSIVRNTVVYGLAGMSIYDIITGGEFLKDLSLKLAGKEKYEAYQALNANYQAESENLENIAHQKEKLGFLDENLVDNVVENPVNVTSTPVPVEEIVSTDEVIQYLSENAFGRHIAPNGNFYAAIEYGGKEYTTFADLMNNMSTQDLYSLYIAKNKNQAFLTMLEQAAPDRLKDLNIYMSEGISTVSNNFAAKVNADNFFVGHNNSLTDGKITGQELRTLEEESIARLDNIQKELDDMLRPQKIAETFTTVTTPVIGIEELESKKNNSR